jgi:hypothetical protein
LSRAQEPDRQSRHPCWQELAPLPLLAHSVRPLLLRCRKAQATCSRQVPCMQPVPESMGSLLSLHHMVASCLPDDVWETVSTTRHVLAGRPGPGRPPVLRSALMRAGWSARPGHGSPHACAALGCCPHSCYATAHVHCWAVCCSAAPTRSAVQYGALCRNKLPTVVPASACTRCCLLSPAHASASHHQASRQHRKLLHAASLCRGIAVAALPPLLPDCNSPRTSDGTSEVALAWLQHSMPLPPASTASAHGGACRGLKGTSVTPSSLSTWRPYPCAPAAFSIMLPGRAPISVAVDAPPSASCAFLQRHTGQVVGLLGALVALAAALLLLRCSCRCRAVRTTRCTRVPGAGWGGHCDA